MSSNKTLRLFTETQTATEKTQNVENRELRGDFVDLIMTLSLTHPDVLVENGIAITLTAHNDNYGG